MDNTKGIVLVVEDDPNDLFFLKRALADAKVANPIHVASDGDQAVAYLSGAGEFSDREKFPLPVLVLLDLKLPRKPGLEVLQWMQHSKIKGVPVVVFTSSSSPDDIKSAYEYGAASYVVKPLNLDDRRHFAALVRDYWLQTNLTPHHS